MNTARSGSDAGSTPAAHARTYSPARVRTHLFRVRVTGAIQAPLVDPLNGAAHRAPDPGRSGAAYERGEQLGGSIRRQEARALALTRCRRAGSCQPDGCGGRPSRLELLTDIEGDPRSCHDRTQRPLRWRLQWRPHAGRATCLRAPGPSLLAQHRGDRQGRQTAFPCRCAVAADRPPHRRPRLPWSRAGRRDAVRSYRSSVNAQWRWPDRRSAVSNNVQARISPTVQRLLPVVMSGEMHPNDTSGMRERAELTCQTLQPTRCLSEAKSAHARATATTQSHDNQTRPRTRYRTFLPHRKGPRRGSTRNLRSTPAEPA
jgi:hypothetical protein